MLHLVQSGLSSGIQQLMQSASDDINKWWHAQWLQYTSWNIFLTSGTKSSLLRSSLPLFQVHEVEIMLTTWSQSVDELRSQYDWLLFFSMPKLLLLYRLLHADGPNMGAIVQEISFLYSNAQASWESTCEIVEVSKRWRWEKRGRGRLGLHANYVC